MSGSRDLEFLLRNMNPEVVHGEYVITTVDEHVLQELSDIPVLVFRENEAITIILKKQVADARLFNYDGVWSLITLNVHSDLSAIGFLSAVTEALARASISVNVVSAFYHDHLFVPLEKVNEAMSVLRELSSSRWK